MYSKFNIVYAKEKNWIVARCLEIDVVSQGRTMKSAEHNIKEAIQLYIDSFGQPDIHPQKSKPMIRSVVISNYAQATPGIRQKANQVPRKAGIRSRPAKRKPRLLTKTHA